MTADAAAHLPCAAGVHTRRGHAALGVPFSAGGRAFVRQVRTVDAELWTQMDRNRDGIITAEEAAGLERAIRAGRG